MLALLLALLIHPGVHTPGSPAAPPVAPPPRPVDPFAKWEKNIAAIEKRLAASPPTPGAVFFAGSSSIVQWDLKKSFPGAGYVNVGFGGSVIADSTHFAPRILTPHKPGAFVFYAGDNDTARGGKPEQVLADFKAFVTAVRKSNPDCRVVFVAIKPSLARWKLFDTQQKANALVRAYCEAEKGLAFVNVVPLMLGPDGKPMPELFVKDGLHLSPKGYELWTAAVKKVISEQ
jgi:lysophospholipase L1-like esterase